MLINPTESHPHTLSPPSLLPAKKKYSKVNETIRERFL